MNHWSTERMRVEELLDIIKNASNELALIRHKCEHPSYFVGMWSWRVGASSPSRICLVCQYAIPGITDEEIANFQRPEYIRPITFTEPSSDFTGNNRHE